MATRELPKPAAQEVAIALVYARSALFLAEESGLTETLLEELGGLAMEVERNPAFEEFLVSPLVDERDRGAALDRLFRGRLSDVLLNTLQVMNAKGRIGLLMALAEAYRQEYEKLTNQIRVQVRTAAPLADSLRRQLEQAVSEFTGKRPTLEESVDESLIGGMVLQVGDRKVDSSLARALHELGRKLRDRASHEIHTGKTHFEVSL